MSENPEEQRTKIIGLGVSSHRKSYYPELQQQIVELRRKNEELQALNEEIRATEEELHANYLELQQREQELIESRANFEEVLDNSIVALYKRNFPADTYDYMSPAIFDIIGYTPEEVMGFNLHEISLMLHPEDRSRIFLELSTLIRKGGGPGVFVYRYYHKDGHEVWMKDICRLVVSDDGAPLYSIGSVQDITERKHIELVAKKAQEKLGYLNTVTFQELTNTNFALTGYLELIRGAHPDPDIIPYLTAASTLVKKMDESLRFAKTYQDMGTRSPEWQDVSITLLNAISHLDLSGLSRTMELEGLSCYADRLLEHAFFLILENILEHSVRATAFTLTCQEHKGSLLLIIEDNGVGVPDAVKESIFEKSYPRRRGMGLFLVREILSITGISITEEGTAGRCARFVIRIPESGYRFSQ